MLAVLVAVRDFVLALVFAWVGVTMENTRTTEPGASCASESCDARDR
ncbi:MAG: hypothetical protein AB7O98_16070 [Hyphomonadaceae bacterium]